MHLSSFLLLIGSLAVFGTICYTIHMSNGGTHAIGKNTDRLRGKIGTMVVLILGFFLLLAGAVLATIDVLASKIPSVG